MEWQPLSRGDLPAVVLIADGIHASLRERVEVFGEKLSLFPEGCRKLMDGTRLVGYGFSHPWTLDSIPRLDGFMGKLPARPQCLYIHDVAVIPEARGNSAAARYVEHIKGLAAAMRIPHLALVSVYGTDALWGRMGFKARESSGFGDALGTYGPGAKYMVYDLQQ